MREKKTVVAVVQDDQGRFLISFNAKWGGYAFPMRSVPEGGDILGSLAIQAAEHDLGCRLPNATATELDYMGHSGVSQRTSEETFYEYWLYTVEPNQALHLLEAPTWNNNPPMFLTYAELTSRTDLTWSTPAIAQEFVENQEAVLAVVTRAGEHETEFLLVENNNYGGYFFPTQRLKTEVKPDRVALATVRSDLGYYGPGTATLLGVVPEVHFSNRFHRDRRYRFQVCEVQLSDIELHRPGSVLEQALLRRDRRFLWLPGSRLSDPSVSFSPTMAAVRTTVLNLVPRRTFSGPLRQSEGGIALIERTASGNRQWLAQWSDNWKAFFFIGGHREGSETFRECAIREIKEELGLTASECAVDVEPAHHLEYRAFSRAAGELTAYTMELFSAHPTPGGLETIDHNPMNKWLDEEEIRRMEAHDGRAVSATLGIFLHHIAS
jgi:8-oxo-dGTP pyrophosphatase MutT (NUDIX family)